MKIYVAASHPRLAEASKLAEDLELAGHDVISTWHEERDQGYADGDWSSKAPEKAEMDIRQVAEADAVVCLTGDTLTRGGRHSEVGAALALGKRVFLLGPREQVFHWHGQTPACLSVEDLVVAISNFSCPVTDGGSVSYVKSRVF